MKKKIILIIFIFILIIGAIFVINKGKNINKPMFIKQTSEYYGLYYISNGNLAYGISIGDSKGNIEGLHTNVIITNETKTGTYIVTCPKNNFTDELVKDNLNYSGTVTLKKLGLNNKDIKE